MDLRSKHGSLLVGLAAVAISMSGARAAEPPSKVRTIELGAPSERAMTLAAGPAVVETSVAAGVAASGTPGASGIDSVTVLVDHAKVIRLPERTQTVVVGNPIVADITVQRNGILVVTGKSYGATNLIALDGSGLMLAESMISVQAPTDAVVTVQRGLQRESYSCTPTCQPSLRLGDSADYFGSVGSQATQRNSLATQQR